MRHESEPAWLVRGLDQLPALPGETLAGRFRIERVIGAGGMGIVLAARDLKSSRRVAIKMLNPASMRPADVARFRLEAEILGSLRSPQVARVYELGELDGLPYLVMEYLDGWTLAEALRSEGPFSVERTVLCLLEICRVLSEVHDKGVVHRDVKLENLMVVEQPGGFISIKLIDFGIAKVLGAAPVEPPACWVGSPRYMAPEQLDHAPDLDHRADIWSVGIVAFELLTGAHPFVADSVSELRSAILGEAALPLAQWRADVPEALARVVERCLMKDRTERFQSVDEISEALVALVAPIALAS